MSPLLSPILKRWRIKVAKPYLSGDVLDLGCGYGHIIALLSTSQKYTGVDESPKVISQMRKLYPNQSFFLIDLDRENLAVEGKFDTIIMLATIEHLGNPDKIFGSIKDYLKQNGRIILTTPTPFGNLIHKIGSRLNLFDIEAAKDHKIIYNRTKIEQLFSKHDLKILAYHTFQFGCNQLCVAAMNN